MGRKTTKATKAAKTGKRRSISFDLELYSQIESFSRSTERGIDESVRWLIKRAFATLKNHEEWPNDPGFLPPPQI